MGLCKCPKKKVTNQFCFEHRVNVCEHCMVTNHPKCIVQSYLNWLQDSDYDPTCEICKQELGDDECTRLVCYHVFHSKCLDLFARQRPDNTAPAGFRCPTCNAELFPANNLVSPVADNLRNWLTNFNWARTGLGLPMIDEVPPTSQRLPPDGAKMDLNQGSEFTSTASTVPVQTVASAGHQLWLPPEMQKFKELLESRGAKIGGVQGALAAANNSQNYFATTPPTSALHYNKKEMGGPINYAGSNYNEFSSRGSYGVNMSDAIDSSSPHQSSQQSHITPLIDHDDNKYRRRSAGEWLFRWLRSVMSGSPATLNRRHIVRNRRIMAIILAVLLFLTLVVIFMRIGRSVAEDDPMLDPLMNPQVRVRSE